MSKTEFTQEELHSLGEHTFWPRMLLFPVLAVIGYVGFVSGLGGDSLWVRSAWSLGLGYCWFCVAGSFHESVHQTMGKNRTANIWFGRVVGTFLGVPYTAYRESHIRHHAYLNTPQDYELWPYSKPTTSLAFRRVFVLFDLFGAVLSGPVVYSRIYFKKDSPISAEARATLKREYLAMAAFWGTVLLSVAGLSLAGQIDWSRFDPMWLLPLPIAAFFNGFRKFTEHLGMSSTDPILGTRTVIGKGLLTRLSSYFNFELFVHGPHHRYPKAPHFELETRLAEYQRKHPDAVVPLFPTYWAALWDTLPWLWNPGVGQTIGGDARYHVAEGVENFVAEVGAAPPEDSVRHAA
ncbi:MAG: fatty acid desaturase [Planctomycetes bacterium]|nr:fatty acid desaturase [Planctomycetota bacterium]